MTPNNEPKQQPINPINPDPKAHPIHPAIPNEPIHDPLETSEGSDPKRRITGDL